MFRFIKQFLIGTPRPPNQQGSQESQKGASVQQSHPPPMSKAATTSAPRDGRLNSGGAAPTRNAVGERTLEVPNPQRASNLYVWIDERSRDRIVRSAENLARRYPAFRDFLGGTDPIEVLIHLVFPHAMPMDYHAANLSFEDRPGDNLTLALRPVLGPAHPWPFPSGCSLIARGFWPTRVESPVFQIQDFFEVDDSPPRLFERLLSTVVYQQRPQEPGSGRSANALTRALAHELPPVCIATREKLTDWTDFLTWKRRLVSERTRGLRFVSREWRGDRVAFKVVGETEEHLRDIQRSISRQDVMAFGLAASVDAWTFRIGDLEAARRTPKGVELGQPEALTNLTQSSLSLAECSWPAHVSAEVAVFLSDDDLNWLATTDDIEGVRSSLMARVPEEGFISVSAAGDLALIGRHEKAVRRLQEQGGYAPFLSSYLFDAKQARVPPKVEHLSAWFRDDLNASQKEAVEKILAAPDLCLVQGPPGTGKTTVIAEAITQLARRGDTVLLVSQAHTAVDNALARLGMLPDLRVIRLARDLDKVSEEGRAFVQDAALARYYESLAQHAEERFLRPWHRSRERLSRLQSWLNRAEFVRRDVERIQGEFARFQADEVRLEQARDEAWRRLQDQAQQHEDSKLRRNRLLEFGGFLSEGTGDIPSQIDMPEPRSTALAMALCGLSATSAKLPVSAAEWHALPQQRPQMLTGLLRFWRRLQARERDLLNDVARLEATGGRALQDPEIAIRLSELEAEVAALADRMEDDESLQPAWRAKRQEIKQLRARAAGGLDPDLYGELFSDAHRWCASIDSAQQAGLELQDRVAAIRRQGHEIDHALRDLRDEVATLAETCTAVAGDESLWRQLELELEQHRRQGERHRRQLAEVRGRVIELAGELPEAPTGAAEQTDEDSVLVRRVEACQKEVAELQKQLAAEQLHQQLWEPMLQDWVSDLRRPGSSQADWEHFGGIFVPRCNVVAITCNEREQTLEEIGQISFDVVIIDEVSKATPLEMLMPLMRARRSVLVGDHRQLPPLFQEGADAQTFSDVVDEAEDDGSDTRTALTRHNLRRFERMVTASLFKSHFEGADNAIRARLEVQFRMHPQIMSMVNHFYEQRLKCGLADPDVLRAHRLTLTDRDDRPVVEAGDHVLWVDTSRDLEDRPHREDVDDQGRDTRSNQLEAELIAHTLAQIDKQCAMTGYSPQRRRQVGVVSFYQRQCRLIRDAIRAVRPSGRFDCLDVEVNTVIRYQGKEKSIILVSLVRNDGLGARGGGGVPRRRSSRANVARYEFINVAFSRAQELLIVFGARSMYESYEVSLPLMDREGQTTRTVYKDILDQLDGNARLIPASRLMRKTAGDLHQRLTPRGSPRRGGAQ